MKKINLLFVALLVAQFLLSQATLKPSIGIGTLPNDSDPVCTIVPRSQGNPWTPIVPGDTMADFTLYDINGNSVNLQTVLDGGKMALIVAGSYTCPIFRNHVRTLNDVSNLYGSQIECFVVYTVEAHPTGSGTPYSGNHQPTNPPYPQPTTYGERKAIVQDMFDGIGTGNFVPTEIEIPVYIDGPCNEWWEYYGEGPNVAYLVKETGELLAYHSWFSNSNPPNGPMTDIWCDLDSLLGWNTGNCTVISSLDGTFQFEFETPPTSYGEPGNVLDIFTKLINPGSEGVEVRIRRVSNDLPAASWASSMCVTVCLPNDQDTVSVIIPPYDTVEFSLHFYTDAIMNGPDTGRVRIRFANANGNQEPFVQSFRGIAEDEVNGLHSTDNVAGFSIFPNPSNGEVSIKTNLLEHDVFRMFDLLGRLEKEMKLPKGESVVSIEGLKKGVYFITIGEKSVGKIVVS